LFSNGGPQSAGGQKSGIGSPRAEVLPRGIYSKAYKPVPQWILSEFHEFDILEKRSPAAMVSL
jgi:hypothetical protein